MEGRTRKTPPECVSSTLEKLKARAKKKAQDHKEKEEAEANRVNIMEAAMPAILAWNMFKMAQSKTSEAGQRK